MVTIGPSELAREKFAGRSATAIVRDIPMKELSTKSAPGAQNDLSFTRQGTGTLFYTARLRYAVDAPVHDSMDNGFRIERRYARVGAERSGRRAVDVVQGGRSGAGDAVVRADEGTPVRGGDRSASGGLRAGRVVVQHDRVDAQLAAGSS